MRSCAKMRCERRASATVALRYAEREVAVSELTAVPDRNLLDLCEDHVRSLAPPLGWRVRDDRNVVLLSEAGSAVAAGPGEDRPSAGAPASAVGSGDAETA